MLPYACGLENDKLVDWFAEKRSIAAEKPENLFDIACCRDPQRRTGSKLPAYERASQAAWMSGRRRKLVRRKFDRQILSQNLAVAVTKCTAHGSCRVKVAQAEVDLSMAV